MHSNDFPEFRAILERLAEVFAKPLTDATAEAYWNALRDQTLAVVRRCADSHTRYGKFFPKPAELRPKEDKPLERSAASEAAFRAALKFSAETWREWLARAPEEAEIEHAIARCARIEVETSEHDAAHQQAKIEMREWMDRRYALWSRRAQRPARDAA